MATPSLPESARKGVLRSGLDEMTSARDPGLTRQSSSYSSNVQVRFSRCPSARASSTTILGVSSCWYKNTHFRPAQTWNGVAALGFVFGGRDQYSVRFGYRHMEIQVDDTVEGVRVQTDLTMSGPIVGFTFKWGGS